MTQQTDKLVLRYTSIEKLEFLWASKMPAVKCNGKFGFIDVENNVVMPCIYDSVNYNCYENKSLVIVSMNKKYGAVDLTGKVIVPLEYDKVIFQCNYIVVSKRGRYGVLDIDGNPITKAKSK
jgi:hypothetical protein